MENISQSIKCLSDIIEKTANHKLSAYNITIGQAKILMMLKETEHISLKNLEKLFNVTQATMQGTISRMEKKGYICTVYMAGDKKNKYVVLTEYGRQLSENIVKTINDMDQLLVSSLTDDEAKEFMRILGKMHSSVC
ncbi:MAG: MarR family transcriptional regulator [Oscillospiraceae bacterium]|nr:MarR family transcriptional regulator [Oscillospiraceae bacterium]